MHKTGTNRCAVCFIKAADAEEGVTRVAVKLTSRQGSTTAYDMHHPNMRHVHCHETRENAHVATSLPSALKRSRETAQGA